MEDVRQLRKNLIRLENKMDSTMEQIRTDMKNFHAEMIELFNEILAKRNGKTMDKQVSNYAIDMKANQQTEKISSLAVTANPSPLSYPSTFPRTIPENTSFSLNSLQGNFISNIPKEIEEPKLDELTSEMIIGHASYPTVDVSLLKKVQLIVVEHMFEYVELIHDRDLDMLLFFKIVDVCEKLVMAIDPYGFRLLVMGRSIVVVVIVKNLGPSINCSCLEVGILYQFGNILSCEIGLDINFSRVRSNALVTAMEMTSCVDTIYHCIILEFGPVMILFQSKMELVTSDIVKGRYSVGDKVPADMQVLSLISSTVIFEQRSLTEKEAMSRTVKVLSKNLDIQGKKCMAFIGTIGVNGNCIYLVNQICMNKEVRKVPSLIHEPLKNEENTLLKRKLNELGKVLTMIVGVIWEVSWLMNVKYLHSPEYVDVWPRNFKFSLEKYTYCLEIDVAVTVIEIPECLPKIITCLRPGTRKMAQKNPLVRNLPNVENFGCRTVICFDKTRPLNTKRMIVSKLVVIGTRLGTLQSFDVEGTTYDPLDGKKHCWSVGQRDTNLQLIIFFSDVCNETGVEQPRNHYVATGMPTEATLEFDRSSMRVIVNFNSGRQSLLVKGVTSNNIEETTNMRKFPARNNCKHGIGWSIIGAVSEGCINDVYDRRKTIFLATVALELEQVSMN